MVELLWFIVRAVVMISNARDVNLLLSRMCDKRPCQCCCNRWIWWEFLEKNGSFQSVVVTEEWRVGVRYLCCSYRNQFFVCALRTLEFLSFVIISLMIVSGRKSVYWSYVSCSQWTTTWFDRMFIRWTCVSIRWTTWMPRNKFRNSCFSSAALFCCSLDFTSFSPCSFCSAKLNINVNFYL